MMKISQWITFVFLLLLLAQCKREQTVWYPEYAFPVASGELSFSDFQSDNILNTEGEVVSIHYYDTLVPFNVNEIVNLSDTVLTQIYSPGFGVGPFPFENSTNIFSLVEEYEFSLDGAELRSGKVRSGTLRLELESNADGYLDLTYSLPGVTLDGEPIDLLVQTTPASASDPFTSELILDISGYEIDFTGESGAERNTLVGSLGVGTSDEPSYSAQIYGSDAVIVSMELLDLEVQELRGYFGEWDRSLDETIVIDTLTYQSGNLSLGDVEIELEFLNNLGVDARIELTQLIGSNSGSNEELAMESSDLYETLNISRAIETSEGVIPSKFDFSFNSLNSNILDVISLTPNTFRVTGEAVLNPLGDVSGGFDFYRDDYPFQMVADVSVPFCLSMSDFTLERNLEIEIDDLNNIESITLNVHLENHFLLGGEFSFYFDDDQDSFLNAELLSAISLSEHSTETLQLTLNRSQIERLMNSNHIRAMAVFNTLESNEVKLLSTDKLEILITAEITYEAEI